MTAATASTRLPGPDLGYLELDVSDVLDDQLLEQLRQLAADGWGVAIGVTAEAVRGMSGYWDPDDGPRPPATSLEQAGWHYLGSVAAPSLCGHHDHTLIPLAELLADFDAEGARHPDPDRPVEVLAASAARVVMNWLETTSNGHYLSSGVWNGPRPVIGVYEPCQLRLLLSRDATAGDLAWHVDAPGRPMTEDPRWLTFS